MSVFFSPKIVTDNLIIYLDARNSTSITSGSLKWFNLSPNQQHLTGQLINGPTFSNQGYISCDGVSDYIEIPNDNSLIFGSGSFSVEYWVRKTAVTVGNTNIWGINKWRNAALNGANEWTLGISGGAGAAGWGLSIESGSVLYTTRLTGSNVQNINEWYQLVGIREREFLKIYLNGQLRISETPIGDDLLPLLPSASINNAGRTIRINNSADNGFFTKADNAIIRIYNRALTDDEIKQNYNAQKSRYGLT